MNLKDHVLIGNVFWEILYRKQILCPVLVFKTITRSSPWKIGCELGTSLIRIEYIYCSLSAKSMSSKTLAYSSKTTSAIFLDIPLLLECQSFSTSETYLTVFQGFWGTCSSAIWKARSSFPGGLLLFDCKKAQESVEEWCAAFTRIQRS